jgi:hypothetical protein
MGTKLTRVTFRITDTQLPQVSPLDNALVINVPGGSAREAAPAVAVAPPPAAPEQHAEVKSEPIAEPVQVAAQPVTITAPVPAEKARFIKSVEATGSGDALQVRINADGAMAYKALLFGRVIVRMMKKASMFTHL